MSGSDEVEVVRGRTDEALRDELVSFWTSASVLDEEAARERVEEVVCVLRSDGGRIVGVNSVFASSVDLIGGRRFWIYRSFLLPEARESIPEMINAAFEALDVEFDPAGEGPIGLCVLVDDRDEMRRRPESVWPGTSFIYAGYLPDGRQARISYFEGATIAEGLDIEAPDAALASDYSIEMFAHQDRITDRDVIDLWNREGVVPPAEAERRVGEVHLVAAHRRDGLVGVSSAYLQRNQQLGMNLWYYRAFVSREHRRGNLAQLLAMWGRDRLAARFESGEDLRAGGLIYEVENPALKQVFNRALWIPTLVTFIGENERGDHVRVRYFEGSRAPDPPSPHAYD